MQINAVLKKKSTDPCNKAETAKRIPIGIQVDATNHKRLYVLFRAPSLDGLYWQPSYPRQIPQSRVMRITPFVLPYQLKQAMMSRVKRAQSGGLVILLVISFG